MSFPFDSTVLVFILGAALRALWLMAEIKTNLANAVARLDNHEQRITALEGR